MSSVAVFVDAGYLYAAGSALISGSARPRNEQSLNEIAIVAELTQLAEAKAGNRPLLRIYWYDAARGGYNLASDHALLAHTDYVKLRLGFMNSQKQQKGVDSLIVTDLIELARNRAISDALLLSGDEDVRIGVQIAQSFGTRVHLLGIEPSRGNQSLQLMQEADTTTEWGATTVARFLTCATTAANAPRPASATSDPFDQAVAELIARTEPAVLQALKRALQASSGIPSNFDGRLIARCREMLGADLSQDEKRDVRKRFRQAVEEG